MRPALQAEVLQDAGVDSAPRGDQALRSRRIPSSSMSTRSMRAASA
jgi:hypothetical protein